MALASPFDAFLLVSFGGPEGPDDVLPFLENVLRGKNVPRERMMAVAEHYYKFGGVSPINQQNRDLIAALEPEFKKADIRLPIYWGNRNWHPLLPDTLRQMKQDGVKNAIALTTSAYSSYSGCRQYRENFVVVQTEVGPGAPAISKLRAFFNHPGFIDAQADRVSTALSQLPENRRGSALILFTAHSIPLRMSDSCDYVMQLQEACRLVARTIGVTDWRLVYQSRSGPPSQPWLAPDICDAIRNISSQGEPPAVVISPIGFLSDHIEVLFDLDTEARGVCNELGVTMVRAATVGTHPRFVQMIRELVEERLDPGKPRPAIGELGPRPDECAPDCCRFEMRPAG